MLIRTVAREPNAEDPREASAANGETTRQWVKRTIASGLPAR